jgi:hypothetical protein
LLRSEQASEIIMQTAKRGREERKERAAEIILHRQRHPAPVIIGLSKSTRKKSLRVGRTRNS